MADLLSTPEMRTLTTGLNLASLDLLDHLALQVTELTPEWGLLDLQASQGSLVPRAETQREVNQGSLEPQVLKETLGAPGPKGEPGDSLSEGEGVQQLREALKILAERVLILEHMIGIHENPLEPGSGLDILADIIPMPAINNKQSRPGALLSSLLLGNRDPIGRNRDRRDQK
ncbi:hypothetical protein JZ751_023169 [Albula glossodonta]|uniref:Uncharacterized protein n=1 Tax=Albula glossodonta TaxID=121402 RepID=A0A8T2PN30_9TELE|nr:hypothetical protein JZ751_023169 [Albula glossodonta]